MRISGLLRVGLAALATAAVAHAQGLPDVDELLQRVGDRVAEFYRRANSVLCIETSTVQPVDSSRSPQGFARTVESELRVEADRGEMPGEAAVVRRILRINGREPRERDKTDRSGCTDPNPLSPDALSFLVPANRSGYDFKLAGASRERGRPALTVDFWSANRRSSARLIEDPGGHEDCFDWSGHIAIRGRVWIDAETYDVLRIERGLVGPVDVRVPEPIQRRNRLDAWVVLVSDNVTIRYTTVGFKDPDEALLLPESIESLTLIRGGLQSTRRTQRFADYQRFVTDGKVLH